MKNTVITVLIFAACAAGAAPSPAEPDIPGYVPVKIRPGTNTVSNLPFTAKMRPCVQDFHAAKPGDTFVWKEGNEQVRYTFDGKAWSGKETAEPSGETAEGRRKALIPIHETFTIIRTANATDVWDIVGAVDLNKAMKQK